MWPWRTVMERTSEWCTTASIEKGKVNQLNFTVFCLYLNLKDPANWLHYSQINVGRNRSLLFPKSMLVLNFFWKRYEQDDVKKKSKVLLKLGLLFETGHDEAKEKESPTFLAFQHKSFQEYTSSFFIKRELEKADNQKVKLRIVYFKKPSNSNHNLSQLISRHKKAVRMPYIFDVQFVFTSW